MSPSSPTSVHSAEAMALVRAYHARTKHRYEAYARGPEALDWDAQPAPFRHFEGAEVVVLPLLEASGPDALLSRTLLRPFGAPADSALPLDLASLGALLQLALGLTAWKGYGPDRWAVRANPSSGNLHPVEAYVVLRGLPFLADGVWHYRPDEHSLECRAVFAPARGVSPCLLIGLSSVMWREAWKYGERAFRYCQLDVGHAVGALAYGAEALGWGLTEKASVGHGTLAALLGLDRPADFPPSRRGDTESEEPELLLEVRPGKTSAPSPEAADLAAWAASARWEGRASVIDSAPMYRWPVIGEIAAATRRGDGQAAGAPELPPALAAEADLRPLCPVILGRRSAQRYDPARVLSRQEFQGILGATRPSTRAPWPSLARPAAMDLLLFVHRVEGLAPGLYAFLRGTDPEPLRRQLGGACPDMKALPDLPGLCFLAGSESIPFKRLTRSLHCHQDMAANAGFALGMLARFEDALARDPASYRDLYREAGLIGQVLYLEAEARGLNACGIGCFFDDPVHETAGLTDDRWQSLYHFTVGLAVPDSRIETLPPYGHRLSPIPANP